MKLLRRTVYVLFLTLLVSTVTYGQSKKKKRAKSKAEVSLAEKPIVNYNYMYFQEWYAGIKVGGTGINVFIPILNDETIKLDSVYFRNIKGKLHKVENKYTAILKNESPYYTWEYPEKPEDYPFDLTADECVVTYTENGVQKYFKIVDINEKAGTYYENGPPLIYDANPNTIMATLDD